MDLLASVVDTVVPEQNRAAHAPGFAPHQDHGGRVHVLDHGGSPAL